MKPSSFVYFLWLCPYLLQGQSKPRLIESQFKTLGDVTFKSVPMEAEKGLPKDDLAKYGVYFLQTETATGLKLLTRRAGIGQVLPPLTLQVPASYHTNFELVEGQAFVSQLTGHVEGKSQRGNMVLDQLNAEVRLYARQGNITVQNSTLRGDLIAPQGDIVLKDIGGSYSSLSLDGQVQAHFSEAFFGRQAKPFHFGLPQGIINAVGAKAGVLFNVVRGGITLQKISQQVEAIIEESGDIQLEAVSGRLRVRTGKGRIWVGTQPEMAKDEQPIEIENSGGDVTVLLPKDVQGILVIEVSQTQDFEVKNKVESSIDFKAEWEELKGEKDKILGRNFRVNHPLGGSKRVIRLRVRNGNLTIKTY